jgi:hypothetical protein
MCTSKQQVSYFYCECVGRKDKAKEHWHKNMLKKYFTEEFDKISFSKNESN